MALTLAAALLALAVVLFVISPILQGKHAPMEETGEDLSDAEARKRVALRALRDAEYDYETGKLDDNDYRMLKGELSGEALEAIRHAEEVEALESGAAPAPGAGAVEEEIAWIREGLRSGVTCGTCGLVNRSGSNFCTRCGLPLDRSVPEPSHA